MAVALWASGLRWIAGLTEQVDRASPSKNAGRACWRSATTSPTVMSWQDSPPCVHDGCLLTLEGTVEFFNLVLELELDEQEKKDLVAFMRVF
jgi:hypothetical protein